MQDKYTKTKRVDAQGRVLIPSSIRETLDIQPDTEVSVKLDGDTIKINVAETRCCICLAPKKNDEIMIAYDGMRGSAKYICGRCVAKIKEA